MMGLFLLCIFVLVTQHSDAQRIVTINKVTVQEGDDIIIPCLYNSKYIYHVKYLWSVYLGLLCKEVAHSDQNDHPRVSISDNKSNQTFTVTMKNILMSDTGYYRCSVDNGSSYKAKCFFLQVTKASVPRELYVNNQMVTGYEGGSVTVSCYHLSSKSTQWCKLGGVCVEASGSIDGASVQLNSSARALTVTMNRLTLKNAGWYWCSVGDLQMPVHITVQTSSVLQLGTSKQKSRKSFAGLVLMGWVVVLTSLAVIMLKPQTQKCQVVSQQNMSENDYESMTKSQPNSMQHGEKELDTQEYEVMLRIDKTLEAQMKQQ